jgi:hypothetical protein
MSPIEPSTTKARLISAEAISGEQSKWANELIKISGSKGVTVGALVGADSHDIRPLLLMGGKTWLLRSTRVDSRHSSSKLLFDCYQRLASIQLTKDVFWGLNDGVFWTRRNFYQGPLDLRLIEGQASYSEDAAQRLVRSVRDLHRADLAHGHICSANIAFNVESADWPVLIDYGFALASTNLDLSALAKARTDDVAGLAGVLELMLPGEAQFQSLINRMRDPVSAKRPSMNEVGQAFLPTSSVGPGLAMPNNTGAVKSGRVIAGSEPIIPKAERLGKAHAQSLADPSGQDAQPRDKQPAVKIGTQAETTREAPRNLDTPHLESHITIPSLPANQNSLLGPLVILFLAVAGVFFYQRWHNDQVTETPATDRFAEYWSSNQRSLMSQVADSAVVDHDPTARMIIASDALKGVEHPGVQSRLIRVAFNEAWEKELSETDRQIVMGLALAGLVSEPPTGLPALNQANPAVAFALAASLPIESKVESLASVSVSSVARMPQPYGPAFTTLVSTGAKSMDETAARALAHILSGDVSLEVFERYLDGANTPEYELARLKVVMPLSKVHGVGDTIWETLGKRSTGVGQAVNWFANDKLQHWDKLDKEAKLSLAVGSTKLQGLQFEQLADLLLFPVSSVRQSAAAELISQKMFPESMTPTLKFLASGNHRLPRSQVVALLSALKLDGESQFAYIAKWFGTSPDPDSVLKLVLVRKNIVTLDPFNVEAARYLQKKSIKPSIADFKIMIGHPEPLIRSLAYAKLSPANPQEAELLRDMAKMEPSDKRRQQIEEKLNTAGKGVEQEHKN